VNVGSWLTRLRWPPASRSAYWGTTPYLGILHVTDGSKRAFGLEVADVGLALRTKNIGAGVSSCSSRLTGGGKPGTIGQGN